MASGIQVYSVEALADFVTDLGRFASVAREDIEAVEAELQQIQVHFQERLEHMNRELERCAAEAQALLDHTGGEEGEEERAEARAALAEARFSLEQAEERVRQVRMQAARVEEAAAAYHRTAAPLRDTLDDGTGRALTFLIARREAIERYLMVAAGGVIAGGALAGGAVTGGAGGGLVGTPHEDARYYHRQSGGTCAIVAQEQVIRRRTGEGVSEPELVSEAIRNGWYNPMRGTPFCHIGRLCEAHGLHVDQAFSDGQGDGMNLDRAREHLARGDSVIVTADAGVLWNDPQYNSEGHTVWLTGIDYDSGLVYVNDTGVMDRPGAAMTVPIGRFEAAWRRFGNLTSICTGP